MPPAEGGGMEIIMKYMLEDIVIINPNYSQVRDNVAKRVICNSNGGIKILNCNPEILDEVFNYVTNNNTYRDIQDALGKKYPINDVIDFLQTLVDEGILISQQNSINNLNVKKSDVLVIGEGRIFEGFKKFNIDMVIFEEFMNNDIENDYKYIVIAPEQLLYKDMVKINRRLYGKEKNYIPVYFNGDKIVFGPLIIPGKTLCLECIISHELKVLNKRMDGENRIELENILDLRFSDHLDIEYTDYDIQYIESFIIKDLDRFKCGEGSRLLDKQFSLDKEVVEFYNEEVQPTTYCNFCHGMNKNYLSYKAEEMDIKNLFNSHFNVNKAKFSNNSIKYKVGGFRSKSEDETKRILDKELKKFGAKIRIEEAKGNPFNDAGTVHCFNSYIDQIYNSGSGFLFRKTEGAGKGLTEQQAYFSAGFELLEHAGLQYGGDIPIISAKYCDVKAHAIDIIELVDTIKNTNTIYDSFDKDAEVDWVVANSVINNKPILVPAFLVFMYDVEVKGMFFPISSSGAAIGTTLEDAVLHGLLESIERDSWLICQCNPYTMPILDYSSIKSKKVKRIINSIKKMGYDIVTRDYTSDLGIPVYRTWIVNKNDYSRYAYNGLGCHVSPELALERSITEAVQVDDWSDTGVELDSSMITLEVLNSSMTNIYNQHYLVNKDIFADREKTVPIREEVLYTESSYDAAKRIVELINPKTNGDVYYVDVTKPGMNIKIIRTIITGDFQRMNIPLLSVSNRMFKFGINCGFDCNETRYENLFMGKYAH